MRTILSLFLLLTIVVFSCSKGGSPASPGGGGSNPPPPPPPPGGGTTTSDLKITGISSLTPYQGDTITLSGTGFDPDKTKDTVLIGAIMTLSGPSYFNPGGALTYSVTNPKTTIISATATELKFSTDATMSVYAFYNQLFAIKVSAGAKSIYTGDTLKLKVIPKLLAVISTDPYPKDCFGAYAGDSLQLPDPKSSLGADYQVQVKNVNGAVMGGVHFTLYK